MNSDSFENTPQEGESAPGPSSSGDEKKSGDRKEIFSLDSIDDSWLDETDIFVRGKDGQLTRKKNPAAAALPPSPPAPAMPVGPSSSMASAPPPSPPPPALPVVPKQPSGPESSSMSGGYGNKGVQGIPGVPGTGVIPAANQSRNLSDAESRIAVAAGAKGPLPVNTSIEPDQRRERERFHFWVEKTGAMRLHGAYLPFGSRCQSKQAAVPSAPASANLATAEQGASLSAAIVAAVSHTESRSETAPEPVPAVRQESQFSPVAKTPPPVEDPSPVRQTESTYPPSSIDLQPANPFAPTGSEALTAAPKAPTAPEPVNLESESTVVVSPAKISDNLGGDAAELPVERGSSSMPTTPSTPSLVAPTPKRMPAAFRTTEPESQSDDAHAPVLASRGAFASDKSTSGAGVSFKLIVAGLVVVGIMGGAGIYQLSRFLESRPAPVKNIDETVKTEAKEEKKAPKVESGGSEAPELVAQWSRDFDKGVKFFDSKNFDKAIVFFTTSIADDSTHPEVYHLRGKAYIQKKRYEDAIQDFSRAIKLKGDEENILIDRAAAYVYSDELRRAERDYSRILKINPENSKASYGRGLVYVKQKKYAEALNDFQSTVDSDPAYLNAYLQMGLIYSGDGKNDKAVASFTEALNIRKRDDLYYERALANYSLGEFDSALSDMSAAIGMNSKRKEYYNDRGYIYMKLNKAEKARADFQMALKLDPGYDLAKQNLEKLTQNQN